ncbi:DEAD/DEAH box helicase family protein [Candidatus Binatia bacterium]|nr:DEAD/DEAH box helicase family protein [Candidatus Binatia bacterium]
MNEADTCRKYVVPKLQAAGWENEPHSITEQRTFTDGRIIVVGNKARRQPQKRADYLLRYTRDLPIAVVEAKSSYKSPADGLQQAKDYATALGLTFAYVTNGQGIIEFDFLTGVERDLQEFPSPDELWARQRGAEKLSDSEAERLLTPGYSLAGKTPRYYQEIAINAALRHIIKGQRRVLLTMATGTGKTFVAFQICWRLWSARWNRTGEYRKPRILFLADRNILVDDPYSKVFAPFGDARSKIEGGNAVKSREMYFAIYQALAADERRPGLYKDYPKDFFDLIVVDECHRGSAREESSWREILEYFEPAYQLGMTATPLREDNRDTYLYFGNPIYQYSLKQGIEDGFLAPYRVHRVITTYDAAGWRPSAGELDRLGREIPDREYTTRDFEKVVALRARTEAIARHLTDFLKGTDRFAKTIVFCVDQEHASEMRRALSNLNADIVKQNPDYVCRVTADEGDIGRGHLSRFQELETTTPAILTTSQLLTTGVDVPTVKNVALVRVIGSMCEFKQIIGRGTRVRDDYGKLFFNIHDYTGSATTLFADPDFDGEPARVSQEEIDEQGKPKPDTYTATEPEVLKLGESPGPPYGAVIGDPPDEEPRKYFYDGGQVQVAAHLVYELDAEGHQLRVVQFTDYTAERVRALFPTAVELRAAWADPERRADIIEKLAERGIDFDELTKVTSQPDADPFDLLCHVAYSAPVRTRRERVDRLRKERRAFLEKHSGVTRQILEELLEKYAEHGTAQFVLPDVLQVPPISDHGNVIEIARYFGGAEQLRGAIHELQTLLYAA